MMRGRFGEPATLPIPSPATSLNTQPSQAVYPPLMTDRQASRFSRMKGREAAATRYGSERSFALRLLYSWLTLTILYLFTWPLLVIYADAPAVNPDDTPVDWFQPRVLAPALTALAAWWLWRLSPVPNVTLSVERALAPFRTGRLWPQLMFFLVGTTVVISIFLLMADPAGALKLVLLTLAEAAVIQIVISGYVHGAFEMLLGDRRADVIAVGTYGATFGLRGLLAAASGTETGSGEMIVALLAGVVVGVIIGAIATLLRNRTGSLLPGFLALWLTFLLLGMADFYDR